MAKFRNQLAKVESSWGPTNPAARTSSTATSRMRLYSGMSRNFIDDTVRSQIAEAAAVDSTLTLM